MSLITYVLNIGLAFLLLVCCVAPQKAMAQVKIGDNPTTINPNSILEMESLSKGLLLPRLNLVATNNPAPTNAFVQGMFVFNLSTNGTGSTAVSPGVYYCDGTQWVRMAIASQQSPFNVLAPMIQKSVWWSVTLVLTPLRQLYGRLTAAELPHTP